ncbi:MAG TPA: DUF29 domain-containing protein [Acetobacteraceae bacterium]|nr:DUF29 domain-containing protein [Acetobacteraceae bacterium]
MNDYDTDIVVWSDRQAELLRRRAAGELVNDAELDWPNIAEEIESVGREQVHAVQSLLRQAMIHRLKIMAWPRSSHVAGWQDEDLGFRQEAADRYTPAMRQRIDLDHLYSQALRRLPREIDGSPPGPIPSACPWTLEQLLAVD